MKDLFPFEAPPLLAEYTKKYIAEPLALDTLPQHSHEVLLSALAFHICCTVVSPLVSSRLFPRTYAGLNRRTRLNWDVHVVSLVQSVYIVILSLYILFEDPARRKHAKLADGTTPSPLYAGQFLDAVTGQPDYRQRIWGYTGAAGLVQSLGVGYFLWDLYISIRYVSVFGLGLLAHAISALWVYSAGYRPFTNHYAPIFLMYELSSPFLNVHWFCDKLNLTGSTLQFANGLILIATFFGSRLVWGIYHSVAVFYDIWQCMLFQETVQGKAWLLANDRRTIPLWMAATYLASNLTLTGLNILWMGKMISTIRARFDPPFGTRRSDAGAVAKKQVVVGRGVDDTGRRSVEVHASESRPARKEDAAAGSDATTSASPEGVAATVASGSSAGGATGGRTRRRA